MIATPARKTRTSPLLSLLRMFRGINDRPRQTPGVSRCRPPMWRPPAAQARQLHPPVPPSPGCWPPSDLGLVAVWPVPFE